MSIAQMPGRGSDNVGLKSAEASLANINRISGNYLEEMEAELNKPPEAPKKKSKAQKRAERKELKRLEAIEDKKLIMRDELRRELELGKRMERRGNEEWHEMCKEIKLVELREEIVEWGERAQRNIEHKNGHITMLLDDMAQTQEQHMRSYGKTVEMIDHICHCFNAMVSSIKQLYEQDAEELLIEYYDEIKRRTEEVDFMHENSENIIHASNVMARDQLKNDYQIYLEQRDDRVNTEIEKRFSLRDQVASKMMKMQHQLNDFVDILSNTELDAHKYERIRWLTDRQAAFMEESRRLNVEEMKYMNMQSEMQHEMMKIETENNATINDLRLELQYFTNVRKKIEVALRADRQITHEKLRILSSECYDVIKEFDKYVKSGELLLSLALNCRKLQTQSEKVVLGGEIVDKYPVEKVSEDFVIKTLNLKEHLDITEEQFLEQYKVLKNFWYRHAMAAAQNLILLHEKSRLAEENERYIELIRKATKTNDVDELKVAITVTMCEYPKPLHPFGTDCRDYKLEAPKKPKIDDMDDDDTDENYEDNLNSILNPRETGSRVSKVTVKTLSINLKN
ncbi:dynein regulatory complex subunit 2 [Scaptodrosophila lebanonensis]|uniref:Dynein regulatory complex subunit 2 n=1 Tax=Drosophila lebanonensis TaxID=7225 RepID=A0A6J2TE10_DROLE|nr:dynein regulatory complex subunit 2 [Scaptodrosophila lebanonensis]